MRVAAAMAAMMVLPVGAGAGECRLPGHEQPPQGEVATAVAPIVYRHDHSKAQLSADNPALGQGQSEAGLTTARTELGIRPQVWVRRQPDGTACVALGSVEVNWRIVAFTVDVASDYPVGSCPYAAILDHENEHVRLTRAAFEQATVDLRRRLGGALAPLAPPTELWVPAGGEARAVAERLEAALSPVVEAYERDLRRRNASIDTAAGYARVQARCTGW